jgi:hypothetical protein
VRVSKPPWAGQVDDLSPLTKSAFQEGLQQTFPTIYGVTGTGFHSNLAKSKSSPDKFPIQTTRPKDRHALAAAAACGRR